MLSVKFAAAAGIVVVVLELLCLPTEVRGAAATAPATQPTTQPAAQVHVVKKGALVREIQTEGTLLAVDPFEVRFQLKAYQGALTIMTAAAQGASVKKGDAILECETTDINWTIENAQSALAAARANLRKAEADSDLGNKSDALAMRMQEDAVKNAEAAVKWWETVDGPQMLLSADVQVKQAKNSVEDQEDELDQLKKMYKSEELTSATADIVVKRAVRRLELSKIALQMHEDRRSKTKSHDHPIGQQRVADGLEQARQQLAALKAAQEQSSVLRKNAGTAARIAAEQAEQRLGHLKSDLALFSVKAPSDGVVLYGQLSDGAWQGGDPRGMRVGEKLAAGQVVMRLVTPGKLRMDIGLTEAQTFWYEPPMKVTVTPAAFPYLSYEATCSAPVVAPKGSPSAMGFHLPIVIVGADPRLLPGMKANVRIEAPRVEDVLLAPVSAISGGTVSVQGKDGKIEKRAVVVGRSDGQMAEIRSGVAAGEGVLLQAKK